MASSSGRVSNVFQIKLISIWWWPSLSAQAWAHPRVFSNIHWPLSQVHKVSQIFSVKFIIHASQSQWQTTMSCSPPGSTVYLTNHRYLVIVTMIDPEPYHTSILSGYGWVYELLEGHPGYIHCELGVSREVFLKLISVLHSFGYGSSRYICRYWGSTCHLLLHVCHWPYYSTHWQVIPAIKQHYFQVLSSYAQNIFYGTVLHHIHKSSWHTPHYHKRSITTQRCHPALLVPLMAAMFHAPLHHIAIHYIGITRDFLHKTAILPVTLIFNLFSTIPGGKGLWQMPRSLKGDCKQKWKYQMGIITLKMWVTCHQMKTSLLLTVVSGIILWSGARLIKSKRLYLVSNFTLISMFRPWTKEELFNLTPRHAMWLSAFLAFWSGSFKFCILVLNTA